MPINHQRMRNMVIRNLAPAPRGSGVIITLKKVVEGEFNPETGEVENTVEEYTGSGVRVRFTEWHHANFDIPYSDYRVYVSPVLQDGTECPTPEIDDTIIFLGDEAKVVNLKPFNDNGVNCGWDVHVRTS